MRFKPTIKITFKTFSACERL